MAVLGPESSKAIAPGEKWWICRCGRPTWEHAHRSIPSTGGREIVCGRMESGRFESAVKGLDYSYSGLARS